MSAVISDVDVVYPESDGKPMADNTLQWGLDGPHCLGTPGNVCRAEGICRRRPVLVPGPGQPRGS